MVQQSARGCIHRAQIVALHRLQFTGQRRRGVGCVCVRLVELSAERWFRQTLGKQVHQKRSRSDRVSCFGRIDAFDQRRQFADDLDA